MTEHNSAGILMALIREQICGTPISDSLQSSLTPELCTEVLKLSAAHDLKHLAAHVLLSRNLPDDPDGSGQRGVYLALYRYQQLDFAFRQACRVLEAARIPFLPLKGAVMRQYYPEPWMRTSCDIDILVPVEQLASAIRVLTEQAGFRNQGREYHDVSLRAPNGMHLELHFSLMEEDRFPAANAIAARVWDYAAPVREGSMEMALSDEFFYFYHILHMANHFREGGCGVRPFLDLWLLDHRPGFDPAACHRLLDRAELLSFARGAEQLAEVWFSGRAHSELTLGMEAYILGGGAFGSVQNQTVIHQARRGGRLRSVFSRIVVPYSTLSGHYPILKRHKWLTPLFQAVRWFRILSPERWKRSMNILRSGASASTERIASAEKLLKALEL